MKPNGHERGNMNNAYVHGYDHRENIRLQDQASTLVELLHSDTFYPAGSRVLEAGYGAIRVSPRMVYVDSSKPEMVEGFTKKTFTAMIEGVRESAIRAGIIAPHVFEKGIRDLYRTTEPDGVFCYTFFKAVGNR